MAENIKIGLYLQYKNSTQTYKTYQDRKLARVARVSPTRKSKMSAEQKTD